MRIKKLLCVTLAVTMLFGIFVMPASAQARTLPDYTMTEGEWWDMWLEEVNDHCKFISLTPGRDETELNFAWTTEVGVGKEAIRVSPNRDLSDSKRYSASFSLSETGYRSNKVTVKDLEENTVYYYSYTENGYWSQIYSFRTLSTDSFKVLFLSDPQIGYGAKSLIEGYYYHRVVANATKENDDVSFIVSAGDNTVSGNSPVEWSALLMSPAMRTLPYAAAVGNHDASGIAYNYYLNNPNEYNGKVPAPTGKDFYFRHGDVLFIFFNTSNDSLADHADFIEKAVTKNLDAKWRIAIMHHDIYGPGRKATDSETLEMAEFYGPLYDRFDIDLVLTGHEHSYGRSKQVFADEVVDTEVIDNTVYNPTGTVYLCSSSTSEARTRIQRFNYEWLANTYPTKSPTYSTLEFDETTLKINTFLGDTNKHIDSYTIVKTEGFNEIGEKVDVDELPFWRIITNNFTIIIERIREFFKVLGLEF